jgi:WD40 repeat protein
VQILKGHLSIKPVRSLAFSPDGTKLASSARDYKTFLWDLASGKYEEIETNDSYTVTFSPDGKTIATGCGSDVTLWDLATGQNRELRPEYDRHDGYGHGWDVRYLPDGKRFVAVSGVVRLYDAATLKALPLPAESTRHATNSVAVSADGSTVATGHDRPRVVRLWDTKSWQVTHELTGATATIANVSFSPDGKYLAACAATTLLVWEVSSGKLIVRHAISKQHYKDVAFSPDGRLLGFARNDASIRFWSTAGWTEVAAYDFAIGPMICFGFAPDGMRAAGGSGKGKIVVFDVDL